MYYKPSKERALTYYLIKNEAKNLVDNEDIPDILCHSTDSSLFLEDVTGEIYRVLEQFDTVDPAMFNSNFKYLGYEYKIFKES